MLDGKFLQFSCSSVCTYICTYPCWAWTDEGSFGHIVWAPLLEEEAAWKAANAAAAAAGFWPAEVAVAASSGLNCTGNPFLSNMMMMVNGSCSRRFQAVDIFHSFFFLPSAEARDWLSEQRRRRAAHNNTWQEGKERKNGMRMRERGNIFGWLKINICGLQDKDTLCRSGQGLPGLGWKSQMSSLKLLPSLFHALYVHRQPLLSRNAFWCIIRSFL